MKAKDLATKLMESPESEVCFLFCESEISNDENSVSVQLRRFYVDEDVEIDEEESIVILSGYEDCQDDDFDIEDYEKEIYGNVGDFSEIPSFI